MIQIARGQLEEILQKHISENVASKELDIETIVNECEARSTENGSSWNGMPE
jgi:hypothetical protein